jgi:hypothetical protein
MTEAVITVVPDAPDRLGQRNVPTKKNAQETAPFATVTAGALFPVG